MPRSPADRRCAQRSRHGGLDLLSTSIAGLPRQLFAQAGGTSHGQVFGGPTDRYGAIGANGPQNLIGVNHSNFNGTSLPELKSGVNVPDCTSFVASHSDVWNSGSAYIVAAGLLL